MKRIQSQIMGNFAIVQSVEMKYTFKHMKPAKTYRSKS